MFNQILDAQRRFRLELMAKQGVVGVAVGYREEGGEATDELAVVALVQKKKPLDALQPEDVVPRELEGARTNVIEVGVLTAHLGPRSRWRPTIPCGITIGHPQVTAGTLGAMVRDASSGAPLILSNNHVLANCNGARVGDEIIQPATNDGGRASADTVAHLERFWRIYWTNETGVTVPPPPAPIQPPSTPIQPPSTPTTPTQPQPTDPPPIIDPNLGYETPSPTPMTPPTTTPAPTTPAPTTPTAPVTEDGRGCFNLIRQFGALLSHLNQAPTTADAQGADEASLMRASSAVRAQALVPENRVDIALARPLNPAIFRQDILNIGRVVTAGTPRLGQQVRKMGRTTGLTTGTITLINATVDVSYNTPWGTRTARFSGQVVTTGMSQGGDSGSLVVDQHSQTALGLLFGGSGVATIFTPIDVVLRYGQCYF